MGAPAVRRLLVVGWSNTGGTDRLVEAAADGARDAVADVPGGFDVFACRCDLVAPEALLRADALLFATPECLGSMAGPMKAFFDRCYYPALDRLVGRPYATLVCAGSDGHGAIRQVERIATGWRLRRVAEPVLVITGAQTPEAILAPKRIADADLARAAELGATLAAGTAHGLW
jgi:multimeric flavodoxin WrbA